MAERLHYASKYKVDYAGGVFHDCPHEFGKMLANIKGALRWANVLGEMEVDPVKIRKYVEELATLPPDEEHQYLYDHTNKQVLEVLKEMLGGYDKENEVIRLSWF